MGVETCASRSPGYVFLIYFVFTLLIFITSRLRYGNRNDQATHQLRQGSRRVCRHVSIYRYVFFYIPFSFFINKSYYLIIIATTTTSTTTTTITITTHTTSKNGHHDHHQYPATLKPHQHVCPSCQVDGSPRQQQPWLQGQQELTGGYNKENGPKRHVSRHLCDQ